MKGDRFGYQVALNVQNQLVKAHSKEQNYQSRELPKAQVLNEEDFLEGLEEIIKRDYFPDLAKLEAYQKYQERQKEPGGRTGSTVRSHLTRGLPSALWKETPVQTSALDRRDPLEKFLDRTKSKLKNLRDAQAEVCNFTEIMDEQEPKKVNVSKMGLDEYLRRYTSEDNQSFQDIHDKERQQFLDKISWMFKEHQRFTNINTLAIENSSQKPNMLLSSAEDKEKMNPFNTRTVPALQYQDHDEQSSFFFKKPSQDLALLRQHQENIKEVQSKFGGESLIQKSNTRLPSEFQVGLQEQMQERGVGIKRKGERLEMKEFDIPEGKVKEKVQKKSQVQGKIELDEILAKNRGQKVQQKQVEQTPQINGYSMVKRTPLRNQPEPEQSPMLTWGKIEGTPTFLGVQSQNSSDKFSIQNQSSRDKIGQNLYSKVQSKKREEKEKQKHLNDKKLQGATPASTKPKIESEAGKKLLTSLLSSKRPSQTPILKRPKI